MALARWRIWLTALRSLFRAIPLWLDPRVPLHLKLIPVLSALYVILPIDLLPDPVLGLGQLDDLAVLLIGLKVFADLATNARADRRSATDGLPAGPIEGRYRVLE